MPDILTQDASDVTSRLPDLGPRGEGWVALQGVLLVAALLAGLLGPAWSGPLRWATMVLGVALMIAGAVLLLRGIVDLRENLTAVPRPKEGGRLIETGSYALVRHPIYGGVVVGSLGWGLFTASPFAILVAIAIAGFFDLKSRREEAWLKDHYPGYEAYRAGTRKLVPWIY